MKVEEAAMQLGLSAQMVRYRMRRGKLPIGICIQSDERWKYIIYPAWLEKWLAGDPVEIPEGMTDLEVEKR